MLFLELLRAARIASGRSQKSICEALGRHRNYIIKVERGERRLDVVELFALCRVIDVDALTLLEEYKQALDSKLSIKSSSSPGVKTSP